MNNHHQIFYQHDYRPIPYAKLYSGSYPQNYTGSHSMLRYPTDAVYLLSHLLPLSPILSLWAIAYLPILRTPSHRAN